MYYVSQKCWATFWATFSQTHLATLLEAGVFSHPNYF
jgi:hypothetical protein